MIDKENTLYEGIKQVLKEIKLENQLDSLYDLFNAHYEKSTNDYKLITDDLIRVLKEGTEKLRIENKSLSQDCHIWSNENSKLKAKIKMLKILIESEDF